MSLQKNPLSIALLGTRGIPARYGGFETFAEELSTRLVARGHRVVVYGRSFKGEALFHTSQYNGVTTQTTPTIRHKYAETPLHALTSFVHLVWRRLLGKGCDVVLLCNAANSPFAWILRASFLPVAINVDGIERKRAKWNVWGRAWYHLGEACSVLFASRIVADAEVIATYYRERFGVTSTVIAYGATAHTQSPGLTLSQFSLTPRGYLLYVSRFEPENNALGVLQAYAKSGVTMPLVMVGDAPYASEYKKRLLEAATPGVVFTGYQFGEPYHELQSNCFAYIQATEVGGTHPALIESMAHGNAIVANGTPENREVLGDAGLFYSVNNFEELAQCLSRLVTAEQEVNKYRTLSKARAQKLYQWDVITDRYEALLRELVRGS